MPFTFSHPALIVPLLCARRRPQWLSATGLIAGSVAPDFEKFIRLKLASAHSHTLGSIFYFSCPVALGLAFVFHLLVRQPLVAHLPVWLYQRLGKYAHFNWLGYFRQYYGGVVLSSSIGAALHLFWDSFTHPNTLTAELLPALNGILWLGERSVPIFHVVSLISSIAGGLLIVWAVWRMPIYPLKPVLTTAALYRYWGLAVLVAVVLEVEWVIVMRPRILNIGISAISAALLGVLVASLYTQHRNRSLGHKQL